METPSPVRVFVCDDSLGFTNLVGSWAMSVDEAELAGTAASADELLATVAGARPDVLLLDLMLPAGPSSPELVDRVRELVPGIRVVLLSSMPDDRLRAEAARIGADAHSTKVLTIDGLLAVVLGT